MVMVGGNDRWRREALCTFGPSVHKCSENASANGEVTGPMPPAAVAIAAVSTAVMASQNIAESFASIPSSQSLGLVRRSSQAQ